MNGDAVALYDERLFHDELGRVENHREAVSTGARCTNRARDFRAAHVQHIERHPGAVSDHQNHRSGTGASRGGVASRAREMYLAALHDEALRILEARQPRDAEGALKEPVADIARE